jgi:hypothetical protein
MPFESRADNEVRRPDNMVFTQGRCAITFHVSQRGILLVN